MRFEQVSAPQLALWLAGRFSMLYYSHSTSGRRRTCYLISLLELLTVQPRNEKKIKLLLDCCVVISTRHLDPTIYINDLPKTIDKYSESILFADDTDIIIANTNVHEYKHNIKVAIHEMNNWFANNLLNVNFDKTYFLQFVTKKTKRITITNSRSTFIIAQQ